MIDFGRREMQRLRVLYREHMIGIARHEMNIEQLDKKWKNIERIYASFGAGTKSKAQLQDSRVFRDIVQEMDNERAAIKKSQKYLEGEDGTHGKLVQAVQNDNLIEIERLAKSTNCVEAKFVYGIHEYARNKAEATEFLKACEADYYYESLAQAVPFLVEFDSKDYTARIENLKKEKMSGRKKAEVAKMQEEISSLRQSAGNLMHKKISIDEVYGHYFDEVNAQITQWENDLKKILQEAEIQEQRDKSAKKQAREDKKNEFKVTLVNVLSGIVLFYLIATGFPGKIIEWDGRVGFFGGNTLLPSPFFDQLIIESDYKLPVIFLANPFMETLELKGKAAEKPIIRLMGKVEEIIVSDYEGEEYIIPMKCDELTFRDCMNLQSIETSKSSNYLNVINCPNLQSIEATKVMYGLEVTNCLNLQSIEATEGPDRLEVTNCPNLQSINAIECEDVTVENCLSLERVNASDERLDVLFAERITWVMT